MRRESWTTETWKSVMQSFQEARVENANKYPEEVPFAREVSTGRPQGVPQGNGFERVPFVTFKYDDSLVEARAKASRATVLKQI